MTFLKNSIKKIKTFAMTGWNSFKKHSMPSESLSNKRKLLFKVILYSLLAVVFLTILMQAPMFVERNLNSLILILWPILLVLILIFDFRSFLNSLFKTFLLLSPFLLYLLLALIFGVSAITGELTRMIFLSVFICVLSQSLAPYISKNNIKLLMVFYIIASIFLGIFIYFSALRGSDISSGIYAYASKNSSAPILFIAALMSFYIKGNNKVTINIFRVLLNAFVIVLIALMKCRTVLITMPFAYFILFIFKKPSTKVFVITIIAIVAVVIVVFSVPQIRKVVIEEILFNNKGNQGTDAIFSGRITLIIKALENLKPVFGSGNKYVDCMPIQILCSYGIIGTIALIPYFGMPIYFLIKHKKYNGKTDSYYLYILILVVFLFNILFEGHGHFGPGAKTFILWMLGGFMDKNYVENKIDVISVKATNKIKNNKFAISFSSLCLALSFVVMCLPSLYQTISLSVYNRVDPTSSSGQYVPVESIEVNGPSIMCIGQKIAFTANVYPEDATDKQVFWESWANSSLSIDNLSGIATAKSIAGLNINAYRYDYKVARTHLIRIVEQQKFDFSQYAFEISLENLTEPRLLIGQKVKINYDKNIFPCSQFISYTASNDVVTIDDEGYVVANKTGVCEIYATITNDYITTSNILNITVESDTVLPIDNIELDIDDDIYQNVDYVFEPKFYSKNKLIEECNYEINVLGSNYELNDGKIRFLNNDSVSLTIKPTNSVNDSFIYSKTFKLLSNSPIDLTVRTPEWMLYNTKYKFEVYINYQNGYSRLAQESEIKPTSTRAGENRSGLCDDYFHYATVKSGSTSITYDLKGTNIYKKKSFTIYTTDETTFNKNARDLTFPFTIIIYLATILSASLIVLKSKKQFLISGCLVLIIGIVPFVVAIFINNITISLLFYLFVGLSIAICLLANYLLKKFNYHGLYENNLILEKKKDPEVTFYEVNI